MQAKAKLNITTSHIYMQDIDMIICSENIKEY